MEQPFHPGHCGGWRYGHTHPLENPQDRRFAEVGPLNHDRAAHTENSGDVSTDTREMNTVVAQHTSTPPAVKKNEPTGVVPVSQAMLQILQDPNAELTGDTIDAYLTRLVASSKFKIKYVTANMKSVIAGNERSFLADKNRMGTIERLARIMFGRDGTPDPYSHILIPFGTADHWFLLWISPVAGQAGICVKQYDSLSKRVSPLCKLVAEAIQSRTTGAYSGPLTYSVPEVPRQNNLTSCGLYVCMFAKILIANNGIWNKHDAISMLDFRHELYTALSLV